VSGDRPTTRNVARAAPGALLRGEASLGQVRKVLRAASDLQKAGLAAELLTGAVDRFPRAFDGTTRAEVRHVCHVLAHLSAGDSADM
jgi:hypothetical protein